MAAPKKKLTHAAAAALGRKGGPKGGPARARSLTQVERSDIARQGGEARAAKAKARKQGQG